jgi:hypothetical protein
MENYGLWGSNPGEIDQVVEKMRAARKDYDLARSDAESKHPILQAYDLDPGAPATRGHLEKLSSDKADDRAEDIGDELTTRLKNIERVRTKSNEDREYVWKLERIVGTARELPDMKAHKQLTHAGLQASVVMEKVATVNMVDDMIAVGSGIVLLGLGLIAAAPTGGLSVAGAAAVAAAGTAESALQLAMAYRAYQTYSLEKAAAGTDFERARALSLEEPSLFWLALDMVGAALAVPGGVKNAAKLFRQVSLLREEALTAKAVKLATEAKAIAAGSEQQYKNALTRLEAAGNEAKPGAGQRVRQEVENNASSQTRGSSATDPDADPPAVRNPDAEPPTLRNPNGPPPPNEGGGYSRTEAISQYFTEIQLNADREYGLIQHQGSRQFRVIFGGMDRVTIPEKFGERWAFVRHYHPNLEYDAAGVLAPVVDTKTSVFGARFPSVGFGQGKAPGDLIASGFAAWEKELRNPLMPSGKRPMPVSETLDWFDAKNNRMRTSRFGYVPDSPTPFWLEVPNDADKIMKREFKTLGDAQLWIWDQVILRPPPVGTP